MDAAAPTYSEGDGNSWWARTADGTNRLVRMQRFQEHSPTVTALLSDDRLRRFAGLTGDGHGAREARKGTNAIEALVKPIGVVEGISDVPWHKDCSLGRHSYRCCSLTVGISVTGADATSGQLRVVPGSHRAVIQPAFVRRGLDLPDRRPAHRHRRRDRPPELHAPHGPAAGHDGASRALHRVRPAVARRGRQGD